MWNRNTSVFTACIQAHRWTCPRAPTPPRRTATTTSNRDELYKNRSYREIDSRIQFSREYDFPKTFSLTVFREDLSLYNCLQPPSVVEFEVPNVVLEADGASNGDADPEGCRRIIQPAMLQVFKGNRNARFAIWREEIVAITFNKKGFCSA